MNDTNFYDEFTEKKLLDELQSERLYIEPTPLPEEERDYSEIEEESNSSMTELEPDNNPLNLRSKELATLLVSLVDVGGAVALGFLSKTKERVKYRLDDDEIRTLENAMKTYLDSTNVKMSPKTLLISSLAVIYGPRAIDAVAERRIANDITHNDKEKEYDKPEEKTEDK